MAEQQHQAACQQLTEQQATLEHQLQAMQTALVDLQAQRVEAERILQRQTEQAEAHIGELARQNDEQAKVLAEAQRRTEAWEQRRHQFEREVMVISERIASATTEEQSLASRIRQLHVEEQQLTPRVEVLRKTMEAFREQAAQLASP